MNMEFAKGFRTLIFNIATLVIVLGGAATGQIENPETLRYIAIAVTAANVILRFLTTGPVPNGGN